MHQLIEPSNACRRLGHRTATRLKQPGPGQYTYCVVCTLGYEMAMTQYASLGHDLATARADEFVRDLRRHV